MHRLALAAVALIFGAAVALPVSYFVQSGLGLAATLFR